ncbi:MAG TPA: histidine phosphatase family protein [Stellaceae bacterium]|jgi:broad specificity phosphatase PhoE|nr:histidine phosphatase family protein [Stellaceae bacterium]
MLLIRHGQSEFNVVYSVTRQDPGIRDPLLTATGRAQAREAAEALAGEGLARLIASPYTRALETAEIIAEILDLPVAVDARVGERAAFACDIGSPIAQLRARWPRLTLDHLDEVWWPEHEESEAALATRCEGFRSAMALVEDWASAGVVTHWGFIRSLTGLTVPNGAVLRVDPTRREAPAVPVLMPALPTAPAANPPP